MDQIICHCVSEDCSKCPMRNTGTSGMLAEWDFFHDHEIMKKTMEQDHETIPTLP